MASTIFAYATCSLCIGSMYDENLPAAERYCWLGRCSHRLCLACYSRLDFRASTCPICRLATLFKRMYFCDATHIVELLCSVLSEVTSRMAHWAAPPPVPTTVLPSSSDDLFTIPIGTHSNRVIQPRYYPSSSIAIDSAPQQSESHPTGFQSFSPATHYESPPQSKNAPTAPRRESNRAPLEVNEEPVSRRSRLEKLDEHQALGVKDSSRLTSRVQRFDLAPFSQENTEVTRRTTAQVKNPAPPSLAASSSSGVQTRPNLPKPVVSKKNDPKEKRSSKAFIANLRAHFDEE